MKSSFSPIESADGWEAREREREGGRIEELGRAEEEEEEEEEGGGSWGEAASCWSAREILS